MQKIMTKLVAPSIVTAALDAGTGTISTTEIADSAITAGKLASDSVETAKIKDSNVTAGKLATDSVETLKIKDSNVTAAKLATDSVETLKIKDSNVTSDKIATGAVTVTKLGDSAVETAKIKDANVTLAKLAAAGAEADIIVAAATTKTPAYVAMSGDATIAATGAVTIANGAVGASKLASDAVETLKIKDANVTLAKIAALTNEADIIVGAATTKAPTSVAMSGDATIATTGAVTIASNAVTTSKLNANAVTKAKFGYKSVAVTVSTGNSSGASAADADLVAGLMIGILPTGNQDQFVDNVVLGADGSVTVTLAAAATADNTFNVIVMKP